MGLVGVVEVVFGNWSVLALFLEVTIEVRVDVRATIGKVGVGFGGKFREACVV